MYCQAQPQLQVKLSLKAELALISFNPEPLPPPNPPGGLWIVHEICLSCNSSWQPTLWQNWSWRAEIYWEACLSWNRNIVIHGTVQTTQTSSEASTDNLIYVDEVAENKKTIQQKSTPISSFCNVFDMVQIWTLWRSVLKERWSRRKCRWRWILLFHKAAWIRHEYWVLVCCVPHTINLPVSFDYERLEKRFEGIKL